LNYRMVLRSLGTLLVLESFAMIPSLSVSLIYNEPEARHFLLSMLIILAVGLPFLIIKPKTKDFNLADGFAVVGIGWLFISIFGAMPFYFSGAIPSFINAFFESISGFTTTGASILTQIESLPKGILFWRSFTHWLGGMGVLVLALAILPSVGSRSIYILKAESPGPAPGKLVPKIKQTAKILYSIYLFITAFEVILLIISGMPLYDSLIHSFGTAGTGGFSSMNDSVGAYGKVRYEIIITVFMLMFGASFTVYFQLLKGKVKNWYKNEELIFYLSVVSFSIILITFNLLGSIYSTILEALRYSSFQVASIISTTGYVTADFNKWPLLSKIILVMLMFVGGCAGSTGGAIKNIRFLILFKAFRKELMKILHPRGFYTVRIGGKVIEEETLTGVFVFFFMYMFVLAAGIFIVSLDNFDIETTVMSVIASIGNIGPGLGLVGASGNYEGFSVISKLVLSFCMLVGRLEIYPILLLVMPSFWKKIKI